MTTVRRVKVAMTVVCEVAVDPDVTQDWQAGEIAYSLVNNAIKESLYTEENISKKVTLLRINDLTTTGGVPGGYGGSIVSTRPIAFDEVLDLYNENRVVSEDTYKEKYKEYSHLFSRNGYGHYVFPWASRTDLLSVWKEIVNEEVSERSERMRASVRKHLMTSLEGAFEDGVDTPATGDSLTEPF